MKHRSRPLHVKVSWLQAECANDLTNRDTLRVYEIVKGVLNKLREVIREVLMADVVQVVIVRILCHATVEVRPGQDILRTKKGQSFPCRLLTILRTIASCLFSIVLTAISAKK